MFLRILHSVVWWVTAVWFVGWATLRPHSGRSLDSPITVGELVAFLVVFGLMTGLGTLTARIASRKGRSYVGWSYYGLIVPYIALPHALLMKKAKTPPRGDTSAWEELNRAITDRSLYTASLRNLRRYQQAAIDQGVSVSPSLVDNIQRLISQRESRQQLRWTVVAAVAAITAVIISLVEFSRQASRQTILPDVSSRQSAGPAAAMPVYQAARRLEPEMAPELEKLFASVARGDASSDQARTMLRSTMSKLAAKHAPRASDETVVALLTVTVENAGTLAASDPKLCFNYLFPRPEEWHDFSKHLPKSAAKRELAAFSDVLTSAAEHPQTIPLDKDVRPLLEGVARRLGRQFGSKAFQLLDDARSHPAEAPKICSMGIAMYKEILALPRQQQGPLLRYLFVSSGES